MRPHSWVQGFSCLHSHVLLVHSDKSAKSRQGQDSSFVLAATFLHSFSLAAILVCLVNWTRLCKGQTAQSPTSFLQGPEQSTESLHFPEQLHGSLPATKALLSKHTLIQCDPSPAPAHTQAGISHLLSEPL
jgi:hypothetical protein